MIQQLHARKLLSMIQQLHVMKLETLSINSINKKTKYKMGH